MFEVTLQEMVDCVDREIRLRESHYPRWVSQGKLTQKTADQELNRMRAVRATLSSLLQPEAIEAKLNPVVAESVPQ